MQAFDTVIRNGTLATAADVFKLAGETIGDRVSCIPDGEIGAQRSLMTPSATHALSRGARAARPSHSRTAP